MRFWLAVGVTVLVGVGATPSAYQVQMQGGRQVIRPGQVARDTQQEPTGTAMIRGRVLSAETGSPLRRAQVRLSSPELRGGRVVTSDADGRYEFRDLPAGRYTMTASKGGYVSLQFRQRRAFEQGTPIELLDQQVIDKADFSLPRGSAITGRILDEFGEPVADAFVQVMRYSYVNGRRQLTPSGRGGQTNDLGLYRIFGLPPGEYYVSAMVRGLEMLSLEMGMTGGLAETASYAPTYYPGTASPAEAQRPVVPLPRLRPILVFDEAQCRFGQRPDLAEVPQSFRERGLGGGKIFVGRQIGLHTEGAGVRPLGVGVDIVVAQCDAARGKARQNVRHRLGQLVVEDESHLQPAGGSQWPARLTHPDGPSIVRTSFPKEAGGLSRVPGPARASAASVRRRGAWALGR